MNDDNDDQFYHHRVKIYDRPDIHTPSVSLQRLPMAELHAVHILTTVSQNMNMQVHVHVDDKDRPHQQQDH